MYADIMVILCMSMVIIVMDIVNLKKCNQAYDNFTWISFGLGPNHTSIKLRLRYIESSTSAEENLDLLLKFFVKILFLFFVLYCKL